MALKVSQLVEVPQCKRCEDPERPLLTLSGLQSCPYTSQMVCSRSVRE